MMLPVSLLALLLGLVTTLVAATVQGTIGFGFAVLSVPVLSLLDRKMAPVPQLLIALPLTLSMLWRERQAVDLRGVAWVLAGRLPGAALGVLLLKIGHPALLDLLLATVVLAAVAIVGSSATVQRNRLTELFAGVASGTFALLASIGGPPLALLYRDAPPETLRATLAALFSIGLLITLSARLLAHEIHLTDLRVAAWLLPALLLGLWISRWTIGRVGQRSLKAAILIVSAIAAAGLVTRALLRW